MLLAVDVGNTQTVFGLYQGAELGERFRIATEAQRTGDELGALLDDFLDYDALDGICLASSVPRLIREYEHVAERWAKAPLLVIGPGIKTGIPIQHDSPHEIGPDRIVNAVAAKERYGAPVIVADFGTSTNFDVVSPAGEYVGGVLAPGVEVSMDALFSRAARLLEVDYSEPPAGKWGFPCYGSVDATALFVTAAVRAIRRRPELAATPVPGRPASVLDALSAAADWLVRRLSADDLGLLSHRRANPHGLENQV